MEDVLVKHKSAEYRQTTVERNCLRDGKTAKTKRKDHWCEGTQGNDSNTSKEGPTHVQVLVIPSAKRVQPTTSPPEEKYSRRSRPHIAQGSHNATCIHGCPRKYGRAQEEQWTERRSLTRVKPEPESVLEDGVLWRGVHDTHHGADGPDEGHAEHDPRVGGHDAESRAGAEEGARAEGGEHEPAACVLEGVVQVRLLCRGEPVAGLAVEEAVHDDDCACDRTLCMVVALVPTCLGGEQRGDAPL